MVGKKGVELPIMTIIILSISVLVLIVVVAMFIGGSNSFEKSQKIAAAWNDACTDLKNNGCDYRQVDDIKLAGVTNGDIGASGEDIHENPIEANATASIFNVCAYKYRVTGKNSNGKIRHPWDNDCKNDDVCLNDFRKNCAAKCGCKYTNIITTTSE